MTEKRVRGKPFTKDDPRRGKGGRPKNKVSLTAIAQRFLPMTPVQIADEVGKTAAALRGLGDVSDMQSIIMAAFLYSLARDPQPGNMRELWRRIDGEVFTPDVDLSKMSTEQLQRLANGEDVLTVLATPGESTD